MWRGTDTGRLTDTRTHVTNIHFTSSNTQTQNVTNGNQTGKGDSVKVGHTVLNLVAVHPCFLEYGYKISCNDSPYVHNCICVGTMSSTSALSIVDENYSEENISADKAGSECKVLSPQRSILKDSNICNILHPSPHSSQTLKVIVDHS